MGERVSLRVCPKCGNKGYGPYEKTIRKRLKDGTVREYKYLYFAHKTDKGMKWCYIGKLGERREGRVFCMAEGRAKVTSERASFDIENIKQLVDSKISEIRKEVEQIVEKVVKDKVHEEVEVIVEELNKVSGVLNEMKKLVSILSPEFAEEALKRYLRGLINIVAIWRKTFEDLQEMLEIEMSKISKFKYVGRRSYSPFEY